MVCPVNSFTLPELIEDSIDGGVPHERLRIRIVVGQEIVDGRDQFLHAAKDATPKALLRQLAEPAFDQVEPRGARGREMQLEARVGGQPLANRFVLVGSVVVQDYVQREVARERAVKTPQELQKFLMPMAPMTFADD